MTANQGPILLEDATSPVSSMSVVRAHRLTVVLSFISIYIIWGSTYLAIRYAVETTPPLYTAALRHLIAATILLVLFLPKPLTPTSAHVTASIVNGTFSF